MGKITVFRKVCTLPLLLFPFFVLGQKQADGYKGIWFALGQRSEYGDKYSGGLGTYTANHVPMAVYSRKAGKTYFVYGGTYPSDPNMLQIMVAYFDHRTGKVPKPHVVLEKKGVNDPHDNPSLSIDEQGYIWIFVSGRNTRRPGSILRSRMPYDISGFEHILEENITYPQPWYINGKGFMHLFTQYTKGRELYWSNSPDGRKWSSPQKLSGFGGHYQISVAHKETIYTVFNHHPDGNVDKRTNLYLLKTGNMGVEWQNMDNRRIILPLEKDQNEAMIHDYKKEGKLVYLQDINVDASGNPVILALVSSDHRPGPQGNPREWVIWKRKDGKWHQTKVCTSTHNYDMGSLYLDHDNWKIIGPSEAGPQQWGTGGEMAMWESKDAGETWVRTRMLTANSSFNHSYARRPINAHKQFYSFWADGHADSLSASRLYFASSNGIVRQLPYHMDKPFMRPKKIRAK